MKNLDRVTAYIEKQYQTDKDLAKLLKKLLCLFESQEIKYNRLERIFSDKQILTDILEFHNDYLYSRIKELEDQIQTIDKKYDSITDQLADSIRGH